MNKILLILSCAFLTLSASSQDIPIKANIILVHGVSFKEVVNTLLDRGYSISKIDSNFNTVETEPKDIPNQGMVQQMILKVRVKDSITTITGLFGFPANTNNQYRAGSLGAMIAGVDMPIANFKMWGKRKKPTAWTVMNNFALSFNKPVEYLVQ